MAALTIQAVSCLARLRLWVCNGVEKNPKRLLPAGETGRDSFVLSDVVLRTGKSHSELVFMDVAWHLLHGVLMTGIEWT